MAEQTTGAPAAPVQEPPKTEAPAKPATLGKASEMLKELAAPEGGAQAEGAKQEAQTQAKDEDAVVAGRLARIAQAKRRVEKERAAALAEKEAWTAEQKAKLEAAANWERFQETKTKKGRLAALDMLFDAGEINGELYTELTDRIYNSNPNTTMTPAQAEELVAKKLADAQKAREEADAKAEEERKAGEAKKSEEVHNGFLAYVGKAFEGEASKYPTLAALAKIDRGVSGRDILAFSETYFEEHDKAPSPEEIFKHFEAEFSKTFQPAKVEEAAGTKIPKTVTSSWSSDSAPREKKFTSLKDSLEEAKREVGLIK